MPPQQARCPFRTSGYVSSGSYGQGSLQIQPTIIQRPASDDAFDAVFDMQTQHANVADPGDATTGDHRYISRARQIDGRFDIAAFQESVASDIGDEQGRDASLLVTARHIGNGHVGSFPSLPSRRNPSANPKPTPASPGHPVRATERRAGNKWA